MRNNEGQTPKMFINKDLIVKAKHAIMDKANYGVLVATIVSIIVFASFLTFPNHEVCPESKLFNFIKNNNSSLSFL